MGGATYICGVPDRCVKHNNKKLHGYPCWDCQEEWRAANPKTAEAISKLAQGKGSEAALRNARKADAEARARPDPIADLKVMSEYAQQHLPGGELSSGH